MFEEYLQDSYEFLSIAERLYKESDIRGARRYYRASVFYASGAIEAFVNYIADCFAKAESIPRHEVSFLNDKALIFTVDKGLKEKVEFHKLDDKIKFLMKKFVSEFNFQDLAWIKFMEFKDFRDSLVHPRQIEDDNTIQEYRQKIRTGLKSIIEIMNFISKGMFQKPLRNQLLDLIPD